MPPKYFDENIPFDHRGAADVTSNFSDFRRWIDVSDFQALVQGGRQLEQLFPKPDSTFSHARELLRTGAWVSRLYPALSDPAVYTLPEKDYISKTVATLPYAYLGGPETLNDDFLQITLWVTVPMDYFNRIIMALANGQDFCFLASNFELGDGLNFNWSFSPRSAVLWYVFMYSIGASQGKHFARSSYFRAATLGIKMPRSMFETGTFWNRFYLDFFVHFAIPMTLSGSRQELLRSMVVLHHNFDFLTLVDFFNHIRDGRYPHFRMLMHLPVSHRAFQLSQQMNYGREPPWQLLLRAPRARL